MDSFCSRSVMPSHSRIARWIGALPASVGHDRLFIESEALTMLAFILPFQSIPWTIGVPFIAVVVGGIILTTKLARHPR